MVKRNNPWIIQAEVVELDAGIEAYEFPPDRVPSRLQSRSSRHILLSEPHELAASGAIHRLRMRLVAADDAMLGRRFSEPEIFDWPGRSQCKGHLRLRPVPVFELDGVLVERGAQPIVTEQDDKRPELGVGQVAFHLVEDGP